jgi:hypothetical protein
LKKTYHIALQLEPVVLKGKSLPNVAALVEAMFTAELGDLLLTASTGASAAAKEVSPWPPQR